MLGQLTDLGVQKQKINVADVICLCSLHARWKLFDRSGMTGERRVTRIGEIGLSDLILRGGRPSIKRGGIGGGGGGRNGA